MEVATLIDAWLMWFEGQLGAFSNFSPAHISVAAVVPFLIALSARSVLAILSTALLALAAIALCATQQVTWPVLAVLAVGGSFLVSFAAVIHRRTRRVLQRQLSAIEKRLDVLEACQERKLLDYLRQTSLCPTVGETTILERDAPSASASLSEMAPPHVAK